MRIAIIEDNKTEAADLKERAVRMLSAVLPVRTAEIYASCGELLQAGRRFDLYLIDCLLPDGNGVELAKELRKTDPDAAFIFTTAYLEYAAAGYEAEAQRYLVKPVSDEKLEEALLFFCRKRENDPIIELTGTLRSSEFVRASNVLYIETVHRKILVRLIDRTIETKKTMREFEQTLPHEQFFRSSRSFLVNYAHVLGKRDNMLIMRNGEHVTLSKRKSVPFNTSYIRYINRR